MDDKIMMDKSLEQVLKQDILEDVLCEASAMKVYATIYGLSNLGRTYFCTYEEVMKKASDAETQMMQRYGNEIYGKSAQLRTQHVTKAGTGKSNMASTGIGSPVKEAGDGPLSGSGGLIHCSVQKMKRLPLKFFEAGKGGDFTALKKSVESFIQWLDSQSDEWKENNKKDVDEFKKHFSSFRQATGPSGEDNKAAWNGINEILKRKPWSDWMRTDNALKKQVDKLRQGWVQFTGDESEGASGSSSSEGERSVDPKDKAWDPAVPVKIDIQTNFDENWYKRKFKSGMLNALIMGFKTAARARASAGGEDEWTGHKYTADEMLPQDVKKLDKIQWKMTNKVAYDYIKYLLGWSRDKKKIRSGTGFLPFNAELSSDPSFGESMAKKGLSNRGFMSRMKQKIFAGGQSNNVISVAFQMADPNDGWTLVNEKGQTIEGADGGGEGKEGAGKEGAGGAGKGGASGAGGGSTGSGSTGATGGSSSGQKLTDKDIEKIKSLLQRIIDLEKQVFGKEQEQQKQVSESTQKHFEDLEGLTDGILMAYLED